MLETLAVVTALSLCPWDKPGSNPYTGTTHTTMRNFRLPTAAANEVRAKIERRAYDDLVLLTSRGLVSDKYTDLRNVHFGRGTVCAGVVTRRWGSQVQRAFVYCAATGECVLVPFRHRNFAQVTRVRKLHAAGVAAAELPEAATYTTAAQVSEVSAIPGLNLTPLAVDETPSFSGTGAYGVPYTAPPPLTTIYVAPTLGLPEPQTFLLFALGALVLGKFWYRTRR